MAIKQMNMKSLKIKLSKIAVTAIILTGFSTGVPAVQTASLIKIPDELIARKLKKHDPSLAISVDAVLYKLRQNQNFTLVDVRSKEDFERLHIPDSVNMALYAVKTKTYLKSAPVVLVNEGFDYGPLEIECRRLAECGFQAFILDGGLPAWKRQGGLLLGDFFALDEIISVAPQVFYREKDFDNTQVIDISPQRSQTSDRLIPYAKHMPVLDEAGGTIPGLKKLLAKHKPFSAVIVFSETGEKYDRAEAILNRMGLDTFCLQGGLAGYQKYLEGLLLSWKPRDGRMKTVSNCRPCGEKPEEEASQTNN
jgi:rhodanese-related sulfurtransferase